ncbi:heme biosynthesis HemY N-terminal domain-containing protein [Alysiella filiformis]|uniref:HemY protein n=1 Tax=Alysiella filiformis DSM 16848 TaxID=1120981 RepID=A0A286EDI6_9NEIS|nr:heme biosynthesis HemY N-terminal domain-containing protein [Alysiella filiformis]QMT31203.1 heme biosynthesis protein HemY [Alysiella filiformis]UBQ55801.1 heme biosynthesis protein HemY [Alysiella filiformis DSM 16848]SOD68929.1 HemY protein [Alysiella filiformis DSM 16848]
MKSLIWIIVLFLIAVAAAIGVHSYSGNVYIAIEQTLIRLNLHLFVVGLLLGVCALYFLVKIVFGLIATPSKMSRFGSSRKSRKAMEALHAAGVAFFEGRYQKAEHEAAKVLGNKHAGDNRILALMIAAQAADKNGDHHLRNQYLDDIATHLPDKSQLPRHLLVAESALANQDYATANEHLQAAEKLDSHLTQLVRLQLNYALAQNDALSVLDKTDKLQKANAMTESEAMKHRNVAYETLVRQAQNSGSLKTAIKRIPDAQRANELCVAIAEQYEKLGLYGDAVAWVSSYYPHTQKSGLLQPFVRSVRYLSDAEQRRAIDLADGWLKHKPKDAALLLNLGEMAFNKQLWGKAQSYLEASIAVKPTVQARLALAKVFDEMNVETLAAEQRRLVLNEVAQ